MSASIQDFIAPRGGAVWTDGELYVNGVPTHAMLVVVNSEFVGNVASAGPGGAINLGGDWSNGNSKAVLSVVNSRFERNTAHMAGDGFMTPGIDSGKGGGIFASRCTEITVENSQFVDNWAATWGGAIAVRDGCPLTVTNSEFYRNRAPLGLGGAICVDHGAEGFIFHNIFQTNDVPQFHGTGSSHIYNTTGLEPMTLALSECQRHPCLPGEQCLYVNFSLWCQPCGEGEISASGVDCTRCLAGTGPNQNHTRCEQCEEGSFSTGGVCNDCPPPLAVNAERMACTAPFQCPAGSDCPAGVDCTDVDQCHRCEPGNVTLSTTPCAPCTDQGKVNNSAQSSCEACLAGTSPNADRSDCVPCSNRTYSAFGIECMPCNQGTVNSEHTSCTACGIAQVPDAFGVSCQCSDGSYNTTTKPKCIGMDYSTPEPPVLACADCDALVDCVDECEGHQLHVKSGWTTYRQVDGSLSIFQCKFADACPGGTTPGKCADSYTGVLCGACEDYYRLGSSGECHECDSMTLLGFIVGVAAMAIGAVLVTFIQSWFDSIVILTDCLALLKDLHLKSVVKVIVATIQIVTNFSIVLNIKMPDAFNRLLGMISFVSFDISMAVGFGCLSDGSYMTSLMANFGMVGAVTGVVYLLYTYHIKMIEKDAARFSAAEPQQREQLVNEYADDMFRRFDTDGNSFIDLDELVAAVGGLDPNASTEDVGALFQAADTDGSGRLDLEEFRTAIGASCARDPTGLTALDFGVLAQLARKADAKDKAASRLFLLVFLLYPGLTNKIFEMFACRELGPQSAPFSVLHIDYTITCDTTQWTRWLGGGLLVLIWPIGLPTFLFITMFKAKEKILADDNLTLQTFDFVLADYKKSHWYW